ncbi:DUF421 domain-containing protein [Nakamurella leprariae]|uniref:DUF421 domain-containing protein n=1 Tax=Nakamurella leprariae TaxID=2803911 RepID=A0A939C3D9_9ACTN|nr:YetF domain-containing protein [Nakamurella leprariae]MBM9469002.1 DUF421 domain-containing protein [Nakamurella leprariae]
MEIVYRAAVMFLFLWLVTRIVGRSTLGELSSFQLILFIVMGDMVQQAVTQQDSSLTGGLLAVSVFAVLTLALSWADSRWPRARAVTTGVAVVVVERGEPQMDVLRAERMSIDDLMAAARQQGFERFSDIRLAVLEANGELSFFKRQESGDGTPVTGSDGSPNQPSVG